MIDKDVSDDNNKNDTYAQRLTDAGASFQNFKMITV